MARKNLLFIHIPKTGGQTVNAALKKCMPGGCVNFIENDDYRSRVYFRQHRYYSGHVRFSQVKPYIARRNFYVFTFLRDPAAQVLSHLAWAKNKTRGGAVPDPREWDEFYRDLFDDVSRLDITSPKALKSFTRRAAPYRRLFDNQQTRFLLEDVREGALTQKDCREALAALETFDFVGVTDKLAQGIAAIAADNGFSKPRKILPKNRNPWRGEYGLDDITPSIRKALEEYLQWDEKLYRKAQALSARA